MKIIMKLKKCLMTKLSFDLLTAAASIVQITVIRCRPQVDPADRFYPWKVYENDDACSDQEPMAYAYRKGVGHISI